MVTLGVKEVKIIFYSHFHSIINCKVLYAKKIVFSAVMALWGVKVSIPIAIGQVRVISPLVGAKKTTQIKHFFIFFIVWIKTFLPDTFILFHMCRIIFVLHFNPYFVTKGHCPEVGQMRLLFFKIFFRLILSCVEKIMIFKTSQNSTLFI
jgi:hypothetical protein